MKTDLRAIANKAAAQKRYRFQDLYRLLNEKNLRWSFAQLRRDAASGVDRMTCQEYEKKLDGNLAGLVERLKQKRYRAQLVKRKYIEKSNGKLRPLGIPALEDKILQVAVANILNAIYGQDFLRCSYGYRKGIGPHDALEDLRESLQFGKYHWVVESDIRGFFDNMDHNWLVRMLEERVDDGAFLRLIKKWLKAGVVEEDGRVIHPESGTPQGGIVSPVLSNIYLHYALDLWFEKVVAKGCQGKVKIIRFADDFVCLFEYRHEAEEFEPQLKERLSEFCLEVAEEKTKILMFSWQGGRGNGKFDFLGFEFRRGRNERGISVVKRRTSRKRLQAAIRDIGQWIKTNRDRKVRDLLSDLQKKVHGHGSYYGLRGNSESLATYFNEVSKRLVKWLNRRSQRRSYTWQGFNRLMAKFAITCPTVRRPGDEQWELGLKCVVL
jgi:RNA-directed DNA polymerase